ncbi:hypothetical protein CYLTODRAFT_488071 [Cylindrobasidium torrendii FP15055 ss-10]|uniref:Uncharacterized protein n=1 Tax=Cylindrobasidium torrendii FP15055 ss-10 TaxID=1314674 RepID=A0A0D7BJ84_9AGAR|nr:hypothetical protein CYLTODRAFT_488071 [Cylindrobasidium torrendii FP15055 ss-10]
MAKKSSRKKKQATATGSPPGSDRDPPSSTTFEPEGSGDLSMKCPPNEDKQKGADSQAQSHGHQPQNLSDHGVSDGEATARARKKGQKRGKGEVFPVQESEVNSALGTEVDAEENGEEGRRVLRSEKGLARVNYAPSNERAFRRQISILPEKPRVRPLHELKNSLHVRIEDLVLKYAFKPGRDIDSNAPLRAGTWQFSHGFGKGDNILLGLRVARDMGAVFDINSFMNIVQRRHESHYAVDNDLEGKILSMGDIEMCILHCENNVARMKAGKTPLSIFEAQGFDVGTVFTYTILDFGRDSVVEWWADSEGCDLDYPGYHLDPTIPGTSLAREQFSPEHPLYSIPALIGKTRRLELKHDDYYEHFDLDNRTTEKLDRLHGFAHERGWLAPATQSELKELVSLGVLESTTCQAAKKFRGLDASRGKEAFFTAKKLRPREKEPVSANNPPAASSLASRRHATTVATEPLRPVTPPNTSGKGYTIHVSLGCVC